MLCCLQTWRRCKPGASSETPPRAPPRQTTKERRHARYLDKLELPTLDRFHQIAREQERKEKEVEEKYRHAAHEAHQDAHQDAHHDRRRADAAGTIQRTYRGHRERRHLQGLSLDPSTRWLEALKEAQYRNITKPRPRPASRAAQSASPASSPDPRTSSEARQHWRKLGQIARRARGDDSDRDDSASSSSASSSSMPSRTPSQRRARREARIKERQERARRAIAMDLPYFLEMVDLKHRYGSNLRAYHNEWKRSDTQENFFYWLDHGEGKNVSLQMCDRERLDKEQVRYLSREERLDYLTSIDNEGRLCWMRNGIRIDTTEEWKDSIHGIVPKNDSTPAFKPTLSTERHKEASALGLSSSSEEEESDDESDGKSEKQEDLRYGDEMKNAKGPKKVMHVSPSTILDHLLRKSVKKNTWIFVADISMNLYVGIKQSGAFQHSSFLHGSRILAAGLIKIKKGQLRSLSPLSGHYRPPTSSFRAFVHSLKHTSPPVDTSHVSISKSYAVLVGLESYTAARKRLSHAGHMLVLGKDKVVRPEEVQRRREEERDKTESARLERERVKEEKYGRWGVGGLRGRRSEGGGEKGADATRTEVGGEERGAGKEADKKDP